MFYQRNYSKTIMFSGYKYRRVSKVSALFNFKISGLKGCLLFKGTFEGASFLTLLFSASANAKSMLEYL